MDKRNTRAVWIIIVIALIGLAAAVSALLWQIGEQNVLPFVCVGLFYVLLLFYGVKGYQKPHGNMIQLLMLILAVYVAVSSVASEGRWISLSWITRLAGNLAAVFMGFMAGRLNKVEENRYTTVLISVLLCVRCLWLLEDLSLTGAELALFILDRSLALLMWITLALVYFFRFKAHKSAGNQ